MMKLCTVVALSMALGAESFVPLTTKNRKTFALKAATSFDRDEKHLSFNPMQGYQAVDVERARDCAEHFGKCSPPELKDLRDNLHKERLQKLVVPTTIPPTGEDIEHRLLEEELDMQLHLLQDENLVTSDHHRVDLFPEVEAPMEELPHLKDNTESQAAENLVHLAQNTLALEETVLNEEVLETLVICSVVMMLAFVPQLISM